MRLKTTLFLFISLLYFSQVEAQSCSGADFETRSGIAVLELNNPVPSGFRSESISGATSGTAATYRGSNNFRSPGNVTTYKLKVNSTGTYRVQWRNKISIITTGPHPANTEHNDSWLKINGSDFFGQSGSSKVYPKGSNKTPIVNGDSANGFMKIFTSSVNWSWTTRTNDGGGHDIFVTFNNTGVYNVQVGGRSQGHTLDRIVLYKSSVSSSSALSTSRAQTTCDGSTPPPPPADNVAPTVSITSPSNGQSFDAGSNITVNLSANDSDGSIQKHEIFVNNSRVDTDGTSYSAYTMTNAAPGNYAIKATVTDNGGKTASTTINVSVGDDTTPPPPPPSENAAPTVSITSPSNGQTVAAGSNVSIALSANDSDGSVVKHEIFVNGSKVDTDGTSYTPHIIRNIATGSYAIKATVTDNGGKTASTTINISAGGDTTPPPPPPSENAAPVVSFTNLSNGNQVTPGSTVSVGVSASDSDGSVVKYQVFVNGLLVDTDGANYTPHPIRNITAGDYVIKVTVTDNQGATASTSVTITAGSDATPPPPTGGDITFDLINASTNGSIGELVNGASINASKTQGVNIRINAPANSARVGIELYRNGAAVKIGFENVAPYAVFGDRSGDYFTANLASGSYKLIAAGYSSATVANSVIARKEINFTVGSTSGKSAILFPNPVNTTGKVSVRLPEGSSGKYEYNVTNSLGVQVERGTFDASSSQRDVELTMPNIGRQVQGVYYMTLSTNGSRETIPLIRE